VQHSSCSFSPSCVHMRPLGNSNVQMCTPWFSFKTHA
jgi:hypothetical protein